ncbi:MAG TPA: Xaa-Pro peptidase family protein [Anaerolineae bacterium]|nr:Xaa-Pro peptidase family protein [Anaerolineae bacterium]
MSSTNPQRLKNLQRMLSAQDLDAMVILNVMNIRYLCGFTGSAGVLVVTPNDATLYVDARYTEQAQRQVVGAKAIEAPRPVLNYAVQQFKDRVKRVGFEANRLTYLEYQELKSLLPDVELVGLRDAVEQLRAVKDESEIELIQRAINISDGVFDAFCGWLEPGMVEDQAAARLEYEQRVGGGGRKISGTIVAAGERTALPHGIATQRVVGTNEPVMIDIGTVVDGYTSDLTRTVYLGQAPDDFKKIYQIVYDAQQRALDGIRAGITGSQAHNLAHDVITAAGYGDKFGHSLGHCIGLDIHEYPLMNPKDFSILKENMVFTVEPGIYLTGKYGVRIEDVVRITANGCEMLTHSTRLLREI